MHAARTEDTDSTVAASVALAMPRSAWLRFVVKVAALVAVATALAGIAKSLSDRAMVDDALL